MRFHPASALLGLAVAGLAMLTMSQGVIHTQFATPLRVEYVPHPRDLLRIEEGVPYTVPSGKLFVPTAMGTGTVAQGYIVIFLVNGQEDFRVYSGVSATDATACTMKDVPFGRAVPAGSVITLSDGGGESHGRAWGYLADQ